MNAQLDAHTMSLSGGKLDGITAPHLARLRHPSCQTSCPSEKICPDLKFFVGRVNFDQLGGKRATELSRIPTRLKIAPEEVEMVVAAGRDALRANPTFRAFLSNP